MRRFSVPCGIAAQTMSAGISRERCHVMLLDMNKNMSAKSWREWVKSLREEAERICEKNDRTLSQELVLFVARKLEQKKETMTAQTLVALLNEVDQFRGTNWQYSESCRGPCSSVRGVYNAYVNAGQDKEASTIAKAFKTVRGTYAYE